MTAPPPLTPEQKAFLAHACAFLGTKPSQEDLDKLLVFAAMLLPEAVAEELRKRAAAGAGGDHAQLSRWLQ